MKIINGQFFINGEKFEKGTLEISNGYITDFHSYENLCDLESYGKRYCCLADVESSQDNSVFDASGCYVVPGFMDVHFHGCMGQDFSDGDFDGLKQIAIYELQHGITSICPATMTLSEDALLQIVSNGKLMTRWQTKENMANLLGFHLEGPFISKEKKGAQDDKYILAPDIAMFRKLLDTSDGYLKLTTIAPETEGAMEFIEAFHKEVAISLGHTSTDYETAFLAFQKGANHVTHLFNAMPSFHHRESGLIGAAFDALRQKPVYIELICDGVHVSDPMVRSAFALFSDENIVLISDSMRATGMPDGVYSLGGQEVSVKGNQATLKNGTLAGSVTNLYECFLHAVKIGIPLESALKAVTINPAKSIGVDKDYGSISTEKVADLLILNSDLTIRDIIFHGERLAIS